MKAPIVCSLVCCGFVPSLLVSAPAMACRSSSDAPFRTSSALLPATDDTTPPSAIPSAWVEDIVRDDTNDTRGNACAGQADCILIGTVEVGLTPPTDDTTPEAQIGYIVSAESHDGGRAPNLWVNHYPSDSGEQVLLAPNGRLLIDFMEPAEEVLSLDFDLLITPVDLAGNRGDAYRLRVRDSDAMGCQASRVRGFTISPVWFIALFIVVGMIRRRRIQ
jgi:hypothetical protein